MAPVVINSVIQLPVHLVTLVLRKLRLVPTGSATHHTFPVAGLDEGRAHAVLYALRQAALDAQVELSSTSCCQSSLISSTFCCRCSCVLFELRRSKLQNCGWWLFNWHRSPQTGVIKGPGCFPKQQMIQQAVISAVIQQQPWMTCLCRLLRDLHTVEANLEFWQNRLHRGSHLRFMLFGQGPVSFAHDVLSTLERKHRQRTTSATDKIERRVGPHLAWCHSNSGFESSVNSHSSAKH